ncbi:recombinase family protein [Kitasatospora aureofaciens]|uniref:recombinase family protein n=1 Tax=Kitasatospora aureofaciens TaxID=1894 RepID=UPI001C4764E0|nr:recombinase family protein [Kitasatospora aureofaciens]MBV6698497.1 recombinase family protein [Kitasatospora aureofaciens]
MGDELIRQVQWGRFEGQNWAGLTRLSTEEEEGELTSDMASGRAKYLTGKDIKSTDEQEKDDREFVESRGGRYVYTYTEPDTSAWKRRRVRLPDGQVAYRVVRPVFEGALGDLKARRAPNGERLDGLIVYDIDRLTRDPRHLEDAIDVVQRYGVPIIDITGSLDLLTDNGRAMARVITAMNNKSSADTARRVKRKHTAMQRQGIPGGGPRPFGWQEDRRTLEPDEARLLRDAANRMLAGGVWYQIVTGWTGDGIVTASGKPWTVQALKKVLSNPRICGYRSRTAVEFDEEAGTESAHMVVVYDDNGEPTIGQHEPILTVEQWQAICDLIDASPGRGTGHNTRKYLGTGTLRCGKDDCGAKLRAMKASPSQKKPEGYHFYQCPNSATGQGCGGVRVGGPETDELIRKLVIAKHQEENAQRGAVTAGEAWPHEEKLARVREDIADAKQARRDRQISAERYYKDLAEYEADERRLVKERNVWQRRTSALQGHPIDVEKEWERPDVTLAEKRAYVERAFTAIVVKPVGRGSRTPLRERLIPIYNES